MKILREIWQIVIALGELLLAFIAFVVSWALALVALGVIKFLVLLLGKEEVIRLLLKLKKKRPL